LLSLVKYLRFVYNEFMAVGIFGGAFDPFHREHEKVAEAAIKELFLDKLVLVPSYNPPHKDNPGTGFADRVRMLEIWAEGTDNIVIDTVEAHTGYRKNYAVEVIAQLIKKYGDCVYLIGGDSMVNFHTWVKPEVIAKEVSIAVAMREGFPGAEAAIARAKEAYGANITRLSVMGDEVSSGEIRARLELGLDVSGLIDKRIQEYILSRGLYNNYTDLINRLKNLISAPLFRHAADTAVFAARYATQAKVGFCKAFTAGLLHDCAKERVHTADGYPTDALSVVHQYMGAEVAEKEYGVHDPDILGAIACHTTGKPAMSPLDKLLYIADKLEDGRTYDGVGALRGTLAEEGLEAGFIAVLKHSAAHLATKGTCIDGLTKECLSYYNIN